MNKLLYISTGIPQDEVKRLRKKQFDFSSNAILPTSIFHGNIIAGLCKCYDAVTALSGVPISNKNYNIKRYSAFKRVEGNVSYIIPGFFNYPIVKQLTTTIKIFGHALAWGIKNRKHNRNIIIDGTFMSGLISLWFVKKLCKIKVSAIIVDLYGFMDPKRETKSQKIYFELLKSVDCFVFVTKQLEELINLDDKEYMIMEGLVDENVESEAKEVGDYCVYAGGLQQIYGVKNLVDAFHETDLPFSLHLYGNGDSIDYINTLTEVDSRIKYKGLVSHDELLEIESQAKLLVNPRPVHGELDTRYNFPSKLMEFMQSGRPVLTTKLLGIPKEYEDYMFFFEDDDKESIKSELQRVLSLEESYLANFGKQAQTYVNENKTNVVVAKKMFQMINGVEVKDDRTN